MARVIFLGTAGGGAVVHRQLRASGGIILQAEDLQFHIDPGPGAIVKAKEYGINLHHTTAILVTHNHINHCNDLNAVIDAMTHGGIEHRGVLIASKSVLQVNEYYYPAITKYHLGLLEKSIPMEKNHKVGIELIEINALPAEHSDKTALGFKFFCPKFTLSYSGDTIVTDALIEAMSGSDLLILNVPYPDKRGQGLNLDVEGATQIISKVRPKIAIITHFGYEMLRADPINAAREIQHITGVETIAAQDGLAISPMGEGPYKSPVRGFD